MTNTDGTKEPGRKCIADIFADFYETPYKEQRTELHQDIEENGNNAAPVPEFTVSEFRTALKQLKKRARLQTKRAYWPRC